MADQVELRCRCGEVRARVTDASPRTVNRVVCYCADCQAFAHRIGRADLLDAQGGSDIVQIAPDAITFTQGQDRIEGLRLSPKGLFRWYANCCNSPVGNTMTPALPFVGFLANGFEPETRSADDVFGRPVGAILGKSAIGTPPPGSTGRCCSAPSARCSAGACAARPGRTRSSRKEVTRRFIRSRYCRSRNVTRCGRSAGRGLLRTEQTIRRPGQAKRDPGSIRRGY